MEVRRIMVDAFNVTIIKLLSLEADGVSDTFVAAQTLMAHSPKENWRLGCQNKTSLSAHARN